MNSATAPVCCCCCSAVSLLPKPLFRQMAVNRGRKIPASSAQAAARRLGIDGAGGLKLGTSASWGCCSSRRCSFSPLLPPAGRAGGLSAGTIATVSGGGSGWRGVELGPPVLLRDSDSHANGEENDEHDHHGFDSPSLSSQTLPSPTLTLLPVSEYCCPSPRARAIGREDRWHRRARPYCGGAAPSAA